MIVLRDSGFSRLQLRVGFPAVFVSGVCPALVAITMAWASMCLTITGV